MHSLPHSVPLTLQKVSPKLRLHQRLLDMHRQVWASLFWGHCSFLLGPDVHKVFFCVCVPQESVSPVLCKFCIQSHSSPKSNALGVLPGTQVGKSVVVPRSSLTVREFLWYNYSAVSGLSAWRLSGGVNGELLQEGLCHTLVCCNQSPRACSQPLLTRASVGDTRTLNLWLRS